MLVDDQLVCACLVLAAAATDRRIVTIEAIADAASGALSVVQQAFVDAGAVQCGFCTPGLVMAVDELCRRASRPTPIDVREAISGNICRCTGYGRILDAIGRALDDAGMP